MIDAGPFPGDILIFYKAIEARNNHVIVAILNDEFGFSVKLSESSGIQNSQT